MLKILKYISKNYILLIENKFWVEWWNFKFRSEDPTSRYDDYAQIFEQSLSIANGLYLTIIQNNFEADTFFPELDKNQWKEISKEPHKPDEKNVYSYIFKKYEKI
jgi:hypothetical protein